MAPLHSPWDHASPNLAPTTFELVALLDVVGASNWPWATPMIVDQPRAQLALFFNVYLCNFLMATVSTLSIV
jgi:hypothetical protein